MTDAIAPAGLGPGRYQLRPLGSGDRRGHGAARARIARTSSDPGITMKQNAANLRQALGFPEAVVRKLTLENPRIAIGCVERPSSRSG